MFFKNGPEYEERLKRPFVPPTFTLKEVHDAVPKHLLRKNQRKAALYVIRDIVFTSLLYKFAYSITPWAASDFGGYVTEGWQKTLLKASMWGFYWWFQGLVFAGIFCLGHDAGHTSLFESNKINNTVGFLLHSYLLIPYFSWRSTHHAHHKATGSMERDENYVPYTRSQFNLPSEKLAKSTDYSEIFEETPLYTLYRMFIMQGFGWWVYLARNTMGSPMYPPGTNHFSPYSPLFKKEQRFSIFMSNVGLGAMSFILYKLGREFFLWYYLAPYVLVNHWIVMFTFLHHSDPTIPHYRKGEWSFLRGAVGTVDRPLLGWMGRFFFHNISHDHVAHHFFLRAPFYNGPEITKAVKSVLKEDYNYDSTPSFYALYRSFTQCLFIEDEGDIVFYKNKEGKAVRELKESVMEEIKAKGWDPAEQDKLSEEESKAN
ncbi:Delta(12) fatty acid desaturase [Psilocybe cubensis]|uniref:Fatty acid desaturase domain-containing protein n=2 Tax=Psilocybe cubensis TaxID=181762 RepID=A0A8H8CJG9_PSICU|nr:Delta(12) fatty acid desaturase [Psilocybe cubensis]KAH9476003.1 Delta(12) fatty acid desaturase [Psilocybe cubensis]